MLNAWCLIPHSYRGHNSLLCYRIHYRLWLPRLPIATITPYSQRDREAARTKVAERRWGAQVRDNEAPPRHVRFSVKAVYSWCLALECVFPVWMSMFSWLVCLQPGGHWEAPFNPGPTQGPVHLNSEAELVGEEKTVLGLWRFLPNFALYFTTVISVS